MFVLKYEKYAKYLFSNTDVQYSDLYTRFVTHSSTRKLES